ncbi:MAG: hypothetical protein M1816_004339 [Peltula sp. TS41687]|nr:MAG: hypothetical protein M1816_004339 [Peltula sp. TS41687]
MVLLETRYLSVLATCLTVALTLPTQAPEKPPGEVFIPNLNPDQQPTLEGCVQWFIQNHVQFKIYSREEAQIWCYRYHPQGALYEEAKSPRPRAWRPRYLVEEGDARGARTDDNKDNMTKLGNLSKNVQDFAIRILRPFADVKHLPAGGLSRPILGGFQPILSP